METTRAWVDFNLIKSSVTMEMLVVQYGITGLARNGDELRGACPIHRGKGKREFSINLAKDTFCCFAPTCKARGNVLDSVAKMERCNVRDAALKLDGWFGVTAESEAGRDGQQSPRRPAVGEGASSPATLISEIEERLAALKKMVTAG